MRTLFIGVILLSALAGFAQRKKRDAGPLQATPPPQTPASPFTQKTSGMKAYPGFIEFYYDSQSDKIFLAIAKLDYEFLYVESVTAGVGSNDIGLDRNQLGRDRIVKFQRSGPKILLVEPNYAFRAVSTSEAERKSVEEAFAQSILWGFMIAAEEGGKLLVDATDFFFQDSHDVAGTLRLAQQGNYTVDKSRSAFYLDRTRNFPRNSEFEVTLTFTGQPSGSFIRSVTPTPSSVTLRSHHSFAELPDAGYHPRDFDPRAGYFSFSFYDFATPISEPLQKRFITRHRLRKKDPTAAVSEAVEPIVYYMDPGVPEPVRSALLTGARWWSQAFEAIGYKDAFRVELLPVDADPMDLRYNVINWVHRSTRGWSYGATVTDPRTGEIIKGHVTLGSLRVRQDFLIAEGLLAPYEDGSEKHAGMEQMSLRRLEQLAAHEVGHTLGLAHSYSSSAEGRASVMDYPHPNVKLVDGKIDMSNAYDNKIGAFDKFSIAYGYQDFAPGVDEHSALSALVQESLKAGLTFLSDQDARPVGGAHPYAHLWDNGTDPVDELLRVLEVRAAALRNFGERNVRQGTPMALLEDALVPMYFFHRYQTEAASKLIGGLNYRYALRGDGQPVTELLTPQQQIKAFEALMKTVEPAALSIPESLIRQIPPRPIGYVRHRELFETRTNLTFDPLAAAETAADMTFGLLLHPARINRVFEHHARDARLISLESFIDRMISATFKSAQKPAYEGAIQQAVDHALFANLSKAVLLSGTSPQAKAVVSLKLDQLRMWTSQRRDATRDETWKAFYGYVSQSISRLQTNPKEFMEDHPLAPPPGQPIGEIGTEFCGSGAN